MAEEPEVKSAGAAVPRRLLILNNTSQIFHLPMQFSERGVSHAVPPCVVGSIPLVLNDDAMKAFTDRMERYGAKKLADIDRTTFKGIAYELAEDKGDADENADS